MNQRVDRAAILSARAWLLISVAVLPWLFGGVDMSTRAWWALSLLPPVVLAALVARPAATALRYAIWPFAILVAGCTLGAWQLTELSAKVDPRPAELRADFASTSSDATNAAPLSVHPPATRRMVALLFCAAAAFGLGVAYFGDVKALLSLKITLAVVGTALAGMGIVDRAGSAAWNYAGTTAPMGTQPFGPFINRNNAAGFLDICLAAALGLFVWRLKKLLGRTRADRQRGLAGWTSVLFDPSLLATATASILILAGVMATLSRGGLSAVLVGSLVAVFVFAAATRSPVYFWPVVLGGGAALTLVVWMGQGDNFAAKWMTFSESGLQSEARPHLWRESLEAARTYRFFGAGLGTFAYAHAPFQRHGSLGTYEYGENQYVEALVVGGYVGCALLCVFGLLCLSAVRKLLRDAVSSAEFAVGFGGICLLLIQAVYACFDFGWYLPALAMPLALWCGGLLRLAGESSSWRNKLVRRSSRRTTKESHNPGVAPATALKALETAAPQNPEENSDGTTMAVGGFKSLAPLLVVVFCFAIGLFWAFRQTQAAAVVERARRSSRALLQPTAKPTLADVDAEIEHLRAAVTACPDDGEVRVRLAELLAKRYEVRAGQSTFQLYSAVTMAQRIGNHAELERLRTDSTTRDDLFPAWNEARLACSLCPFNYFAHLMAAQLCFLDAPSDDGAQQVRTAERLAQGRSDWLLMVGAMHFDAARFGEAWVAWRRACSLNTGLTEQIFPTALAFLGADEALRAVVPNDPEVIVRLAQSFADAFGRDAQTQYYRKALDLTLPNERSLPRYRFVRGVALAELGQFAEAESAISDALRAEHARGEWYFELAAVRSALGKTEAGDVAFARYQLLVGPGAKPTEAYRLLVARWLEQVSPPEAEQLQRAGDFYIAAGDAKKAAEVYRRSVAMRPHDVPTIIGLVNALLSSKELAAAEATAAQALKEQPTVDALKDLLRRVQQTATPAAP